MILSRNFLHYLYKVMWYMSGKSEEEPEIYPDFEWVNEYVQPMIDHRAGHISAPEMYRLQQEVWNRHTALTSWPDARKIKPQPAPFKRPVDEAVSAEVLKHAVLESLIENRLTEILAQAIAEAYAEVQQ